MGSTIVQQFGGGYIHNVFYLVTGTVATTQFPSGTVGMVRFKAHPDNIGLFTLGDGVTQSFWLDAGDDTGWVDLKEMEQLYYSDTSGTLDYLGYWLQV